MNSNIEEEETEEEAFAGAKMALANFPFHSFSSEQLHFLAAYYDQLAQRLNSLAIQKAHQPGRHDDSDAGGKEKHIAKAKAGLTPLPSYTLAKGKKSDLIIILSSLYRQNFFISGSLHGVHSFQSFLDYVGKCLGTTLNNSSQVIYNIFNRHDATRIFDVSKKVFLRRNRGNDS